MSQLSTSHLRSLLFDERAYTCVHHFTTHVEVFCLPLVVFSELTLKQLLLMYLFIYLFIKNEIKVKGFLLFLRKKVEGL